MKFHNILITVVTINLLFLWITFAAPSPVNWQCGTINWTTISQFPISSSSTTALCQNWEVNNFTNNWNSSTRNLTWNCEWIYWWTNVSCSAIWNSTLWSWMATNWTGCWLANNQSFISNAPNLTNIWIAYTNTNNQFLWKLCKSNTAPISYNESTLWRDWICPWTRNWSTFINQESCHADFFYDSQCGNAAATGQANQPTTNLCTPGNVATMVRYNTETNRWEWECSWWWAGAISFCNAWATSTSWISPQCNPFIINPANWAITWNFVNWFPWTNLCWIWYLSERDVDTFNNNATWKCKFWNQTTPICWNVYVNWYAWNAGQSCNGLANGQTFDKLSDLTNIWLCSNWKIAKSFDDLTNKREWSCWIQNCEAFKNTSLSMCWFATNIPTLNPPSQWLCAQWQVVSQVYKYANTWKRVCSDIQNWWFCNNLWCQLNYPNQAAICEAPRIVIWACARQTLINPAWYHTPNQIIQSWLCLDWYPDPLIPIQNTWLSRWSWTCRWTPIIGSDSQLCLAKAWIPSLNIVYSIPRPKTFPISLVTWDLLTWPVIASVEWYDPLYLTFTTPYNQNHRLFTQNWYFQFNYSDWAWNTWNTMVFVDWIKTAGPNAFPIYSTTWATSWNVDVILSWYNSAQNPTTFAWPCLAAWHCSIIVWAHPYDLKIRFTQSSEWTFTITDSQWITKDIFIQVDNIDTTIPTATLHYSHTTITSSDVIVEVISQSEPITITNNSWSFSYRFTNTWEFTFKFVDTAWNANTLTAIVTWIDKDAPTAEVIYSTTWVTDQNVYAVLSWLEQWVRIHNNWGSNSYNFTYNWDFAFILVDSAWLTWTVLATVSWINKPILSKLIKQYNENICNKIKHRMPVDIQTNEHNFEIITAIRNCLMQSFNGYNKNNYFYPRKYITRWEFLRVVWRFIQKTSDYSDQLINNVSDQFIWVAAQWWYAKDISEADARWLLFYTPLIPAWVNKKIDIEWAMPQKEAKYIIEKMLELLSMDKRIAGQLINQDWNLTRWEAAFIFSNLMLTFEDVAVGNNLELLKALEYRITSIPTFQEQKVFITKILLKLWKIPDNVMKRVWLHPLFLKQDLIAILQSKMPTRKPKVFLTIKTIIDNYLTEFSDPHNNAVFNDNLNYEYKMFDDN